MRIYRGQIVSLNVEQVERNFQEFGPFTSSEIYKVIDNLDNNKAPGPGYINAWALKTGKKLLEHNFRLYSTIAFQSKK